MWHCITHRHLLHVLLLFFMLSLITTANDVNISSEAKALLSWWPYVNASLDCCRYWVGITCNEAGSVIGIRLNGYHLELHLENLDLDFSPFLNLVSLTLDNCGLGGRKHPIADWFASNLTSLSLHWNELTGNLPIFLTNLTHLESLDLSNINFSGELPLSFTNLTRLTYLDLSVNNFSGELPASLANLTSLKQIDLSNNKLTGPIPPSYGSMINLTILDLSTNELNASIPNEITNLQNLLWLDLGDNKLDGPIPSNFSKLSWLYFLNLGMNSISGPIPLDIENLMHLRHLDLNLNNVVGPISRNLSRLYHLDVSSNRLSGHLSLQSPCNLQYVDLSMNQMTGSCTSLHSCNQLLYLRQLEESILELNKLNSHARPLEYILDKRLPYPTNKSIEEEITRVYNVALACILTDPKCRPTMRNVSQELSRSDH